MQGLNCYVTGRAWIRVLGTTSVTYKSNMFTPDLAKSDMKACDLRTLESP